MAGRFYPSNPEQLALALDSYLDRAADANPEPNVKACIAPHAGYVYSGPVAGAVYRRLPQAARVVILGPNHFGVGQPLAVVGHGSWRTPLGETQIDETIAGDLLQNCPGLVEDPSAHAGEHSIEVQIPFLQRWMGDFQFVPIVIGDVEFQDLLNLGRGLASALSRVQAAPLIVASTDMNHYESDEVTRAKDQEAIMQILAMDPAGLYDVLRAKHITMCGYGPVISMLVAVSSMKASEAILVSYATSADAGATRRSVVGYAGIIIK